MTNDTATRTPFAEARLKAVRFDHPDFIPARIILNPSVWYHWPREQIWDLVERYPAAFMDVPPRQGPDWEPQVPPFADANAPYTDPWGCVWETTDHGITGTVTHHPVRDLAGAETLTAPDPVTTDGRVFNVDWDQWEASVRQARANGELAKGGLVHGHTFLTLLDLAGYEGIIMGMADEDPRVDQLVERIETFNTALVERQLRAPLDWFAFPEDLGMQVGPMLSPTHFQRYIKPSYQRMMTKARDAGTAIHMHSDGDIRTLANDLIDGGVECLNLQDQVNGIDWIAEHLKGRVCIDLDIDRQHLLPFGTPAQVDAYVKDVIDRLGDPAGGLSLFHDAYAAMPIENLEALAAAFERHALKA